MAVPDAIRELPLTKQEFGRAVWYWSASNELTTPDGLDGIRTTHPYADSRLLAFMLAIPEAVRWQPDQKRALMRQALGPFLTELVRDRKGKGFSLSAIVRTIRPLAMRLHGETGPPEIVERGFVDRQEWTRQLEALINGSLSNPGQIEKLMQVEAWLRGLAARRARGRRVVAQAGTSQGKEVNDNVCKA